ncbi:MAG: S-layer homology domain-containing protein [Vulcanimicrobiota bacterium]
MLRRNLAFALGGILLASTTAWGAPLFPDVKDEHWAKDAVAKLAAQGLLEGYPDGTFKGDRAATRWEVAMIVARLLAKMEQAHATFATKAELDEVRKLAAALKDELDALGVRVTNLEESVDRLDKRVTELERITFYGYVDTRMTTVTLQNNGGLSNMTSLPGGVPLINYNAAIGSSIGAGGALPAGPAGFNLPPTFNPFATGVLTTNNWRTGRPLVNGVGFTSRAVLGLRINVTDDIDAGAEFSAYTSQGNRVLDAYYGANAPYLLNAWTANNAATAGLNGLSNSPQTSMVLDNFWVKHRPSNTKLLFGAYQNHSMDGIVYKGQINPNEFGPEYLPQYGFQLTGEHAFDEDEHTKLYWEVLGTKLPNGNLGITGLANSYYGAGYGANVKLSFNDEAGAVKLNYWRMNENALNDGGPRVVGLNLGSNAQLNWVNPNGYFRNQVGLINSLGIGTTSDVRPIPGVGALGADGSVANAVAAGLVPVGTGVPNVGGIGPQDQTTYGISGNYTFDVDDFDPRVYAEYGHSVYKPNAGSSYSVGGNAFRIGGGAFFWDKQIEVDAHYLRVDPTYSPFIISSPTVGTIGGFFYTPDFYFFNGMMPTSDVKTYPHNREGIRAKLLWKFNPTGRVQIEYGNLSQTRTSMQDVRFSANSLGVGTPNTAVLGFSPGFIDPLFQGYSQFTFAPSGGNAFAVPLEDNRGKVENLYISAGHKWLLEEENNNRGVTLSGGIKTLHFFRNSNMSAILPGPVGAAAEDVNRVDLAFTGWHLGVDYDVTEDFTAKVGYTHVDIHGHLDPLGVNAAYASSVGTGNFDNINITNTYPDFGFDWKIEDNVTWNFEGRYYTFADKIPSYVFSTPTVPNLNLNAGAVTAHPFNWKGLQLNTQFLVKF